VDNLLPVLAAAAPAARDRAELAFNGTMVGHRLSAYHFRHS
jgi:hypothetical protein